MMSFALRCQQMKQLRKGWKIVRNVVATISKIVKQIKQ